MNQFLMGALAMASLVAGLFFLRFWRDTRDRLFLIFAVSFWLLGFSRVGLALSRTGVEEQTWLYWVRLLAFVLIIIAIVDKNRPRRASAARLERRDPSATSLPASSEGNPS